MEKYRIRGNITTKDNMNAIYPKIVLDGDDYIVYYSSLDMSSLPSSTVVFEPTVTGLGIDKELLYVLTSDRTYLFNVSILSGETQWGDEVVTFQANITFSN